LSLIVSTKIFSIDSQHRVGRHYHTCESYYANIYTYIARLDHSNPCWKPVHTRETSIAKMAYKHAGSIFR